MRSLRFAILLALLTCSNELFAEVLQTSKGVRISILHHSQTADQKAEEVRKTVAEKGEKEKAKPMLVAKTTSPKGKVKVRSVASGRVKKAERAASGASPAVSRQ